MNSVQRALVWCAVSTLAQAEDDKISLPRQESDALAAAEQHGWRVIDILRVPGHSRHYIDFYELASDARAVGIDAFDRLRGHLIARDFDVFICRDSERFARSQTLHAYIIESIIEAGARIYSLADGFIDRTNYRMFIAMAGYKAASDVDRLVAARRKAYDAFAQRGLPVSPRVVMSHRVVRDDTGRALRVEPDPAMRPLFDEVARLLLEGVAYRRLEIELYRQFGYVNPDTGRPYYAGRIWHALHTATLWGHSALYKEKLPMTDAHSWMREPGHLVPPGVIIYYNTHEPLWTGEISTLIKAEMDRRSFSINGGAKPNQTHMFSGLILCGECGGRCSLIVLPYNQSRRWRCKKRQQPFLDTRLCTQGKSVSESDIKAWIDARLRKAVELGVITPLVGQVDAVRDAAERLARIRSETAGAEDALRTLIRQQSVAPHSASSYYEQEITALADRLSALKQAQTRLELEAAAVDAVRQQQTLMSLSSMIDHFWTQDNRTINQTLHRLFGTRRMVILDGYILDGTVEYGR